MDLSATQQQLLDAYRYHEVICEDGILRDASFRSPYSPLELGTRLNLEKYEIDNCVSDHRDSVYEQKFQVLYFWKQKNGVNATYKEFLCLLARCLPPDRQFLDFVIEKILEKLGCTNFTPTTIAESDAPFLRSQTEPNIDRRMAQVATNLLDISVIQCQNLTYQSRKCLEENKRLKRANSMLLTSNETIQAQLLKEQKRRTTVEGQLATAQEDRNKYMFENAELHSRIGHLQQGVSMTINTTCTVEIKADPSNQEINEESSHSLDYNLATVDSQPPPVPDTLSTTTNSLLAGTNDGSNPYSLNDIQQQSHLSFSNLSTNNLHLDINFYNVEGTINDLTTQPSLIHDTSFNSHHQIDNNSVGNYYNNHVRFHISPLSDVQDITEDSSSHFNVPNLTHHDETSHDSSNEEDVPSFDCNTPIFVDETTQLEWALDP